MKRTLKSFTFPRIISNFQCLITTFLYAIKLSSDFFLQVTRIKGCKLSEHETQIRRSYVGLAKPCTTLVKKFEITRIKVYIYTNIILESNREGLLLVDVLLRKDSILKWSLVVELLIWKKSTISHSLTNSFQENLLLNLYNLCICNFVIYLEKKIVAMILW